MTGEPPALREAVLAKTDAEGNETLLEVEDEAAIQRLGKVALELFGAYWIGTPDAGLSAVPVVIRGAYGGCRQSSS